MKKVVSTILFLAASFSFAFGAAVEVGPVGTATNGQYLINSGGSVSGISPVGTATDGQHLVNSSGSVAGEDLVTGQTWSQMSDAATGGTLIPGRHYKITNFRTYHLIPYTASYNTGSTEPIIVTAVTVTAFGKTAQSTVYPQDIIYYELNDSSTLGGDRGRIYFRHDTTPTVDISVWEDWRNVKYRRWNTQADGLGAWTAREDNGNPSHDVYPFNNSQTAATCSHIHIGPVYGTLRDDALSNTVTGSGTFSLFLGPGSNDNTFGNSCQEITSGVAFYMNTIGDSCGIWTVGHDFGENTIGASSTFNHFEDNVTSITTGTFFRHNHIGEDMSVFTVGNSVEDKTLMHGMSNMEASVAIIGLTQLDITANNAKFAGIINATSTNATENINKVLNQPVWDYEIRPAAGLTLTVTGTAVASLSANGQIIMGAASRVLVGDNGDYIRLRKATVGGFTVAKEVEVNISS